MENQYTKKRYVHIQMWVHASLHAVEWAIHSRFSGNNHNCNIPCDPLFFFTNYSGYYDGDGWGPQLGTWFPKKKKNLYARSSLCTCVPPLIFLPFPRNTTAESRTSLLFQTGKTRQVELEIRVGHSDMFSTNTSIQPEVIYMQERQHKNKLSCGILRAVNLVH